MFSLWGGTVRIFSENDKLEPIASVFDPIIIPVAYVSFCGFDNLVVFYYDCSGQHWRAVEIIASIHNFDVIWIAIMNI